MADPYGDDEAVEGSAHAAEVLEMPDPPPPPGIGADAASGYAAPSPPPAPSLVASPPRQLVQTFLGYDADGRPVYSPAAPAARPAWLALLLAAGAGGALALVLAPRRRPKD